jgi:CRISPR-associated protein Csd1
MLQELCNLAARERLIGDPAFEVSPIEWLINLKPNGEMIGDFIGTHYEVELPGSVKPGKKPKTREEVKKFVIPRQINLETGATRSGIKPHAYFMVDKSEYVFGCGPGTKAHQGITDNKLVRRHQSFIDNVRACYEVTAQPELKAILAFLAEIHANGLPVDLPAKAKAGDFYAFVVRPAIDELAHEIPAVQEYWRKQCSRGDTSNASLNCLVTGQALEEAMKVPLLSFPGVTTGVGLVSFNKPAFESYGWSSNENAPISAAASQMATEAFSRLLAYSYQRQDGQVLQQRNIRITKDTVACFWAKEASGDDLADGLPAALQADPGGKAGQLWRAVWRGKLPPKLDESKFYAVTLTGAQGRAIVRDWYETTVGEVQVSLAEYFHQLDLRPNTRPGKDKELPPQYGLRTLQECLVASRKAEDLPSKYASELFAASINRRVRFPSSLLAIALDRMRAEAGRDDWIDSYRRDARTGLIKAILIRNHQLNLTPTMDDKNKQPGYLLGRLFACIERMQYLALDQVNANIATRYFAAASTTPRLVFNSLLKDLQGHYFKKAQRKRAGAAWMVQRHVCEIQELYGEVMDPAQGYPARFSPVDQGLFMVGYHTQRGLYLPPKNKTATPGAPEEAPVDVCENTDTTTE